MASALGSDSARVTPLAAASCSQRDTRKVKNRLSGALRLAAFGLERSKSRMGEYCRRMKGRLGKAEGITATAHKLGRILYTLIVTDKPYEETQAFPVKPANRQKQLHQLEKIAKKLGFQVTEIPLVIIT